MERFRQSIQVKYSTNWTAKHLKPKPHKTMQIAINCNSVDKPAITQLLRIMKLITFFLLAACLQLAAKGYSQKVTLYLKDASLDQVFKEIRKQTGLQFLYDDDQVKEVGKVTIKVKDVPVEEALSQTLASTLFAFKVVQGTIILSSKPLLVSPPKEKQILTVEGKVLDEKGAPLEGVTIAVKTTTQVIVSDNNGMFSVTVPDESSILVFSFVGYKTQEVAVRDKSNILVRLQVDVQRLSDVVSIGYGTIEKRRLISPVSVVKSDDIKNLPLTSFDQMLQGLASGVFVTNNSGAPGKPVSITIRGRNSINIGDPLIVVDGTPVISQSLGSSFGVDNRLDPLSGINPADIASIEILKDAGAAAIYGSRAANGVILITTKRGRDGKTIFTADAYQGVGIPTGRLNLLRTTDYIKLRREGFLRDNLTLPLPSDLQTPDSLTNTNWQDLVYKPTTIGEYKISMNGGNHLTRFYISSGYRKETNPLSGKKGLERGTFRINMDHKATDRLSVGVSLGGSKDVNQNTSDASTSYSPVDAALLAPPNMTPYDAAGNFTVVPMPYGVGNPIAIFKSKINSNTTQLKTSLNLHYKIGGGLSFHTDLGYDYNNLSAQIYFPKAVNAVLQNTLFDGSVFTNNTNSFSVEPQLRYDNTFKGDHQVSAVAGTTIQKRTTTTSTVYGKGFPSDDLQQMSAAATTDGSSARIQYGFNSVFGRFNYSYQTKYIASATLRRDGSSRFGPGNKYGNFWSVGGGWIFSREALLKKSKFISLGKLRASYGIVGSDALADFTYLDQYQPFSYGGQPGVRPITAQNPNVKWEETSKFDAGIDLGFFDSRIGITLNYFQNNTTNLLITKSLPTQSGFSSIQDNLPAKVRNKGYEVELTASVIQAKDFKWLSKFNFTHEKNVLQEFPGLEKEESFYKYNYKVGESLNLLWGYQFLGIDPSTGTPIYEGFNIDGTKKNPTDPFGGRQVLGRYSPVYYGGWINNFSYKGFSLDVFFHFVHGLLLPNGLADLNNSSISTNNQVTDVLSRWQKQGDITSVPRTATSASAWWISSNIDRQSSRFLSDASFIRLKNVTLAYQFPASLLSHLKIKELRVFATAQNAATWTSFTGIDPETGSNVAPVKMWIGGINLNF